MKDLRLLIPLKRMIGGGYMLVASIGLGVIGVIIIIGGYLIRQNGNTSFIAGNNKVFVPRNEVKLANRIGWVVMLFGLEIMWFPLIFHFIKFIEGYHFVIIAVLHLLLVIMFMIMDQLNYPPHS